MILTYHGAQCFKVSFGDTTLVFNPIAKASKLKGPRFGADIAFITLEHPDFNGVEQVSHGERKPFVIRGPGEYEVSGIFARGYPTLSNYGGETRINTVYMLSFEGMKICFLGALNDVELPQEIKEVSDDIDILFVPIGGDGVLDAEHAHKLAVQLEPKLIIPMHYGEIGEKNALAAFLKEEGMEGSKAQEKLTIKKKDIDDAQNKVVVLGY